MTKLEERNFEITDVREAGDGGKYIEGYAIVFESNSVDMGFIERVAPTALDRSLRDAAAGQANIYAFWSHNTAIPLGSTKSGKLHLEKDARGLKFRLDTSRLSREQVAAVRDGDMQMSFGFCTRSDVWEKGADGKDHRTLLDIDLTEVSPVAMPAYPDTSAAIRSLEQHVASAVTTEPEIPAPPVSRAAPNTRARLSMGLDLKARTTR